MRTTALTLAIAVILGLAAGAPSAESSFAVIVNVKNKARSLDKKAIADAFLKKRTQWSDDVVIAPVDQTRSSAVRRVFSEQVLGRSVSSVRSYWNQIVFSGRGVPPPEVDGDEAVISYVAKRPGAIGYVSAGLTIKEPAVKVVEVK